MVKIMVTQRARLLSFCYVPIRNAGVVDVSPNRALLKGVVAEKKRICGGSGTSGGKSRSIFLLFLVAFLHLGAKQYSGKKKLVR